jgi:hypothetical protein
VLAILGVALSVAVLTRLELHQLLLMGITALIAAANWWWARRRVHKILQRQTFYRRQVYLSRGQK